MLDSIIRQYLIAVFVSSLLMRMMKSMISNVNIYFILVVWNHGYLIILHVHYVDTKSKSRSKTVNNDHLIILIY